MQQPKRASRLIDHRIDKIDSNLCRETAGRSFTRKKTGFPPAAPTGKKSCFHYVLKNNRSVRPGCHNRTPAPFSLRTAGRTVKPGFVRNDHFKTKVASTALWSVGQMPTGGKIGSDVSSVNLSPRRISPFGPIKVTSFSESPLNGL